VELLSNLDKMHQRIRATFPDYSPPSFRVKQINDGVAQVDYYSRRAGLLPFVEGLFFGLGKHFGLAVSIEHMSDDSHPLPCKRFLVHYAAA